MLLRICRGVHCPYRPFPQCISSSSFVAPTYAPARYLHTAIVDRASGASAVSPIARRIDQIRSLGCSVSTGTIVCQSPLEVTKLQILSKLNPLPQINCSDGIPRNAILVLSKAFAGLADDHEFLREAVGTLFGSLTADSALKVHAVVAVVDRIPAPSRVFQWTESNKSAHDVNLSMVQESYGAEYEGIAYLADGAGHFLHHLRPDQEAQPPRPPIPRSQGSLTEATSIFSIQMEVESKNSTSLDTVELPLADTLFINGRRCTLLELQWQRRKGEDEFEQVKLRGQTRLLVKLSRFSRSSDRGQVTRSRQDVSRLTLPLISLTPLRKIVDIMGNVIRKVGVSSSTVGASHELEQSIANYFSEQNIPPHTVDVWAIAVPEHIYGSLATHDDSPSELLRKGATLHRVLSGGGGWGNKAGLISLDPEMDFAQNASENFSELLGFATDYDISLGQRNISQKGDFLAFYMSNPNVGRLREIVPEELPMSFGDITVELGVSSTSDDTTSVNNQSTSSTMGYNQGEDYKAIECFDRFFGALSDRGISLRQKLSDTSALDRQTKIDVPFSRLVNILSTPKENAGTEPRPDFELTQHQRSKYHTIAKPNNSPTNRKLDLGIHDSAADGHLSSRRTITSHEPQLPCLRKIPSSRRQRPRTKHTPLSSLDTNAFEIRTYPYVSSVKIRKYKSKPDAGLRLMLRHEPDLSETIPSKEFPLRPWFRKVLITSQAPMTERAAKAMKEKTLENARQEIATGAAEKVAKAMKEERLESARLATVELSEQKERADDIRSILEEVMHFDPDKWRTRRND